MNKYNNGKIYVIYNLINDKLYFGSTCKTIEKRFKEHLKACNDKIKNKYNLYIDINNYGFDKYYILLLENYNCNNKLELYKREGYYIKLFDSINNGYNKILPSGLSRKDYLSNWWKNNKDKAHEYDLKHKEKSKITDKLYYETNKKDIALKRRTEIIKCDKCDCKIRKADISTHNKSKKHLNKI